MDGKSVNDERDSSRLVHVCAVQDLLVGERKLVAIPGRSGVKVGVFATPHGFAALRDHCPHHGAPLCGGEFGGTTFSSADNAYEWHMESQILRCPWHNWEFDVTTGVSLTDPKVRARAYPVIVEDGQIYVDLQGRAPVEH